MILLADPDPRLQSRVAEQIGDGELVVAEDLPQLEKLLAERSNVQALILGPNFDRDAAFKVAETVESTRQGIGVILIAEDVSMDIMQRALRAGVRDVLPGTFNGQQLIEAVGRARQHSTSLRAVSAPTEGEAAAADHRVITVFSSKGGCGKSFVASNLAVALAQRTGEKVAMVDLDLQFGDLAIMLQLFPARTIYDAAQNLDRLDSEAIVGYLTPHRANVSLLAAPLEPGLSETISADAVGKILRLLRETFRYVVCDCPPSFTDHVLAALDESDECILMTSMDVPSIKNMKLSLQTLQLLGFGRDRIRLILNRADSKVGLTVQAVEKTLGTNVDVSIPSSRDVSVSINRGSPLIIDNPKSPVVASILRMLEFVGVPVAEDPGGETTGGEDKGRFGFRRSKRGG